MPCNTSMLMFVFRIFLIRMLTNSTELKKTLSCSCICWWKSETDFLCLVRLWFSLEIPLHTHYSQNLKYSLIPERKPIKIEQTCKITYTLLCRCAYIISLGTNETWREFNLKVELMKTACVLPKSWLVYVCMQLVLLMYVCLSLCLSVCRQIAIKLRA